MHFACFLCCRRLMGAFTVKSPSLRQRRHLSAGYALRDTSVRMKREKRKREVTENGSPRFRSPLRRKTIASPSTSVVTGAPPCLVHRGLCQRLTLLFSARCVLCIVWVSCGVVLSTVLAAVCYRHCSVFDCYTFLNTSAN